MAIQAVAIATPAETHGAMVREALLAGKDVFVEKPLCLSAEQGQISGRLGARARSHPDGRSFALVPSRYSQTQRT